MREKNKKMKKKKRQIIFAVLRVLLAVLLMAVLILLYVAFMLWQLLAEKPAGVPAEPIIIERVYIPDPIIETEIETRYVQVLIDKEPETSVTDAEKELLAGIVHAEAGNQDMIGKRLIADVVLNRVESSKFPNTIAEVIYQTGQFEDPAENYTADDLEAVEKELQERLDKRVLYFRTEKYHEGAKKLYQHGTHYFSGG